MTQSEIATALHTTAPTYSRWESGQSWPDTESLEKIATLYQVRSSRLFFDPGLDSPSDSKPLLNSREIIKDLQAIIDKLS